MAHMNIILKLSKIIRVCLYVVIMQHVYQHDGFSSFPPLKHPIKAFSGLIIWSILANQTCENQDKGGRWECQLIWLF